MLIHLIIHSLAISVDVSDRLGEEQVGVKLDKLPWRGDFQASLAQSK